MKRFLFATIVVFATAAAARDGLVVLQFDDGRLNHYTHAFPVLESYGLQGSFGVVTANIDVSPTAMTSAMLVEMQAAGHEIHDHTLHHDAAFWGDTLNAPAWRDTIEKSLALLASWGIEADGWNQPGGAGQGWSDALHDTLALFYNYSAGRVGLDWLETANHHWNLHDDPLSLGRGGVYSWGYNAPQSAQTELREVLERMADGLAAGLVVIPVFHDVLPADSTEWGLARVCSAVVDWGVPVVTARDAYVAVTGPTPGWYNNQAPNPDLGLDRNADGRPDAWNGVDPGGVMHDAAWAWLYGPEEGPTMVSFEARSPAVDTMRMLVTWYRFGDGGYTTDSESFWFTTDAGSQVFSWSTTVDADVDRVQIQFSSVDSILVMERLSWIVDPSTGVDPVRPPVVTANPYPNPAADWITMPSEEMQVFDVLGRRVMGGKGGLVDVSGLSCGIYFARLRNAAGSWSTRKFAISR